jgi:hypothetical protein
VEESSLGMKCGGRPSFMGCVALALGKAVQVKLRE